MNTAKLEKETQVEGVRHREYITQISNWIKLVNTLMEPAGVIEKGIAEALSLRERSGTGYPRRAAVLGTNGRGLLAALMLRLRSIDVVAMDRTFAHFQSVGRGRERRSNHTATSPGLLNPQLVEEIGARYVSTRPLRVSEVSEEQGTFDLIVVTRGDFPFVLNALDELGKNGVLVDLTPGDRMIQILSIGASSRFAVKHQIRFGGGGPDREHAERAARYLALADVAYPGWLAKAADVADRRP